MNRLLDALRSNFDKKFLKVTTEMKKDLCWFIKLCKKYNGVSHYVHRPLHDEHQLALDACLTGFGGVFGDRVYTFCLKDIIVPQTFHIAHFELWNILVACRVWAHLWKGKHVNIACDNRSAIDILNFGRTKDLALAAIARNVWLQMATFDFTLHVHHIAGKNNTTADLLSRWHVTPHNRGKLAMLVKKPEWHEVGHEMLVIDYDI